MLPGRGREPKTGLRVSDKASTHTCGGVLKVRLVYGRQQQQKKRGRQEDYIRRVWFKRSNSKALLVEKHASGRWAGILLSLSVHLPLSRSLPLATHTHTRPIMGKDVCSRVSCGQTKIPDGCARLHQARCEVVVRLPAAPASRMLSCSMKLCTRKSAWPLRSYEHGS